MMTSEDTARAYQILALARLLVLLPLLCAHLKVFALQAAASMKTSMSAACAACYSPAVDRQQLQRMVAIVCIHSQEARARQRALRCSICSCRAAMSCWKPRHSVWAMPSSAASAWQCLTFSFTSACAPSQLSQRAIVWPAHLVAHARPQRRPDSISQARPEGASSALLS